MKKKVLFFSERPPVDKQAIHIWLGQADTSHEQLLCHFIGRYLGSSPPKLAIGPAGKPYLPNSPLHFNLSDSAPWLAIAFHWGSPVGIDMEVIRPLEGMGQVIRSCFSQREQAYVQETDSLRRFWKIWNRKEACLKAIGVGLQNDMAKIDCFGNGWISVMEKKIWVRSVPVKQSLSVAVAIHE